MTSATTKQLATGMMPVVLLGPGPLSGRTRRCREREIALTEDEAGPAYPGVTGRRRVGG